MISNALSARHSAIELAAKAGPVGSSVIDVAKLYAQIGILAYSAAHRIVACFDLAVARDFIATFIMIAGGSIVAIAVAAFGGTVATGLRSRYEEPGADLAFEKADCCQLTVVELLARTPRQISRLLAQPRKQVII